MALNDYMYVMPMYSCYRSE